MNTYYFDTSALVKLYIPERGSHWVDYIANAKDSKGDLAHLITIAQVGIVEVAAAIARCQRTGNISTEQRFVFYRAFLSDSQGAFQMLAMTDEMMYLAAELTQRFPLRGYDAVHLASAIMLNSRLSEAGFSPLTFISADKQLCRASLAEGLLTENPDDHP